MLQKVFMFKPEKKASHEELAQSDKFCAMFNELSFLNWTREDAVFFFKYLVEHPEMFATYTIKVEKDIMLLTSDRLKVKKAFDSIAEYGEVFNPTDLISNWQLIEYFSSLMMHIQKIMRRELKEETQ